jgi:hypothetical protein
MVCVQPDGAVKPDTVGPPMKGVDVRILDSGEIVLRCPGLSASTTRTGGDRRGEGCRGLVPHRATRDTSTPTGT